MSLPPPAAGPRWHPLMAFGGILLGFGIWLVGAAIIGIVAAAGGSSLTHPTPAVSLLESFCFDVAFVAAALFFVRRAGRLAPEDFGFRRIRLRTGVGGFLLAGVAYYVVTALYASLLRLHGNDKLPSELGIHRSTAALAAAAVFVCVVAPIAEEFFFRGFVFGALRTWRIRAAGRDIGTVLAAIVTGLLFGLAHAGSAAVQYLLPLAFLGFVLCILRWRTGSLYPGMALHAFNNALALGTNELHWQAAPILGLMLASWAVIAVLTGPFSRPRAVARS
jgi:membrane protease YdiL (CAAX protease family)